MNDLRKKLNEELEYLKSRIPYFRVHCAEVGGLILQNEHVTCMSRYRLIFGISGKRYHKYQKGGEIKTTILETDDLLLVPPGAGLIIGYREPCKSFQVNLSSGMGVYKYNDIGTEYESYGDMFYNHICQNPLHIPCANDFAGLQICSVLFEEYNQASKKYSQNLLECILENLQQVLLSSKNDKSSGYYVWNRICEYIDENYTNEISRAVTAKKFRLHPNHISRLFKRFGKCSFNERLNQRRLEHTLEQLKHNPELSIAEIAYNSGFNNVEYFNRKFRKATGKTPTEWRHSASPWIVH